jgi:serine/threonine protein kinase
MAGSRILISGPKIVKQQHLSTGIVEATYLSTLSHPNLIKAEQIEISPNGEELILTERRHTPLPRTLPDDQRKDLLDDMIEVLAYLEAHDVVHHDVTPVNMVFDAKENRYVLLDLNRCTPLGSSHLAFHSLTAPEVDNGICDYRNDLFSLAVSLILLRNGNKNFYTFPVLDHITVSTAIQKKMFIEEYLEELLLDDVLSNRLRPMLNPLETRPFASTLARKKYPRILDPLNENIDREWVLDPIYEKVKDTMQKMVPFVEDDDHDLLIVYQLACWKNFETPLVTFPTNLEFIQRRRAFLAKISFTVR